ncbi:MAG: replication initiation protein [Candidatus Riflebacteria bacterium]|nr:replication initiation protein [Candidatus Riflebacteria bacterium]
MKGNYAVVKKANSLIEASYKLSINEQRLVLMLAASVKVADTNFQSYRISVKDFARLLNLKNKNIYKEVEKIVVGLREKTLKITQSNSVLHIGWLSSIEYFTGEGILDLCFDPKLKPFLLDLNERFTSYKLKLIIQLRSSFSVRIYELLKQYERLGTRIFDLDKLKMILGLEDDQYKLYANFKRKVILVAQKELTAKTDIAFDFEEIKIGRGIGKIKFIIRTQNAPEVKPPALPEIVDAKEIKFSEAMRILITLLPAKYQEMASIKKILMEYLRKHDFDYVARNIEYANDGSNAVNPGVSLGKGSNYRNYLAKALKSDFGLPYQDDKNIQKLTEEEAKRKAEEEAKERRKKNEQERHEREIAARAEVYLKNLSPEALETLKLEAISQLEPKLRELYDKKSLGSEMMLRKAMEEIAMHRIKID